jgi:clan AA aspartic protease
MSLVYTELTLRNALDEGKKREGLINEQDVRQMTVQALVDTGAWTMVINEATREKLGLDVVGSEPGTLADGTKASYDMVGPLEVMWKNRRTSCDAIVLPDAEDILFGAIPLEAMDLTVNPRREVVGVHGDQIMHSIKVHHAEGAESVSHLLLPSGVC